MANVRDSDTSLWLHNKLGTSNDSWTGDSICSQLNSEVLRNIKVCFTDLQTQVKLKLLLSFFHISNRNINDWKVELEEILEVAQADSDRWVSVLGELMKNYPSAGVLDESFVNEENKKIFDDLMKEIKNFGKKQPDIAMLPLELFYLNKPAFMNAVGHLPAPKKHFLKKDRTRAEILKDELLQKCIDLTNNMKKHVAPTVPVRSRGMPRKMTDTTPLKGLPSRAITNGFKSSVQISAAGMTSGTSTSSSRPGLTSRLLTGRKDCAIKLLDIAEQPVAPIQYKKRKRMQEQEDIQNKRPLDELPCTNHVESTVHKQKVITTTDSTSSAFSNNPSCSESSVVISSSSTTPSCTVSVTSVEIKVPDTSISSVPSSVITVNRPSVLTSTSRPSVLTSVPRPSVLTSTTRPSVLTIHNSTSKTTASQQSNVAVVLCTTGSSRFAHSLTDSNVTTSSVTKLSASRNTNATVTSRSVISHTHKLSNNQSGETQVICPPTPSMSVISSTHNSSSVPPTPGLSLFPNVASRSSTHSDVHSSSMYTSTSNNMPIYPPTPRISVRSPTSITTVYPPMSGSSSGFSSNSPSLVYDSICAPLVYPPTSIIARSPSPERPPTPTIKEHIRTPSPLLPPPTPTPVIMSHSSQSSPVNDARIMSSLSCASSPTPGLVDSPPSMPLLCSMASPPRSSNTPTYTPLMSMPPTSVVGFSHSDRQQSYNNVSPPLSQSPVLTPLTPVNPSSSSGHSAANMQRNTNDGGNYQMPTYTMLRSISPIRDSSGDVLENIVLYSDVNFNHSVVLNSNEDRKKDQLMLTQEMFNSSNKVTRPEKALILAFMSGSRENPCPHLGNIVTIKLSECTENVRQTDGTTIALKSETHFQMNYNTGCWKRIKRFREFDPRPSMQRYSNNVIK